MPARSSEVESSALGTCCSLAPVLQPPGLVWPLRALFNHSGEFSTELVFPVRKAPHISQKSISSSFLGIVRPGSVVIMITLRWSHCCWSCFVPQLSPEILILDTNHRHRDCGPFRHNIERAKCYMYISTFIVYM